MLFTWKILSLCIVLECLWELEAANCQAIYKHRHLSMFLNGYFFKVSVPLFGFHILTESIKSKSNQNPPVLNKCQ